MSIDELTASQRAAWDRGRARSTAAMAACVAPTVASVSLDRRAGGGERQHIGWCLTCQQPYPQRCTCGNVDPLAVIEHVEDALDSVADVIAATRDDLSRFTDATDAIDGVFV